MWSDEVASTVVAGLSDDPDPDVRRHAGRALEAMTDRLDLVDP